MKHLSIFVILVLALTARADTPMEGLNKLLSKLGFSPFVGGYACAACTLMVLQFERFAVAHSKNIDEFISRELCGLFKNDLRDVCTHFIDAYGAQIIHALYQDISPDAVCRKLGSCDKPQCNIAPRHQLPNLTFSGHLQPEILQLETLELFKINKTAIWDKIKTFIWRFQDSHKPDMDLDKDDFSATLGQARGYHWRGRDCDDANAKIYPGRKENPSKLSIDYNCNGIYGYNPKTLKPWKQELCDNTNQMGFAVLGDSVGAHFEIPPDWVNGSSWTSNTFNDVLTRMLDEFDLPHLSGWSGYVADSAERPSRSLYQYLVQRNKCNHRDYQNIGINGATMIDEGQRYMYTFSRNQTTDHPMLVVLEVVGNDVCSGPGDMTNPDRFRNYLDEVLAHLDTVLPKGSHVMMVGLVDGRLLYQYLHDRIHPSGVTYTQFYDYLNCLDSSPCAGWMNSNETIRNETTERANELNQIYKDLVASGRKYNNFDYDYYDFPAETILGNWVSEGKDPVVLIEPVDGFHPSQTFHALMADHFWEALLRDHPDWLGPENPNNAKIEQLFGKQGGH